jgi:hypothetical protein
MISSDSSNCSIIKTSAHFASTGASVGEKAVLVLKPLVSKYRTVSKFQHYGNLMCSSRLELRQVSDIPAAAERFHQRHAGAHAPALDIDLVAFVGQRHGLRRDNL